MYRASGPLAILKGVMTQLNNKEIYELDFRSQTKYEGRTIFLVKIHIQIIWSELTDYKLSQELIILNHLIMKRLMNSYNDELWWGMSYVLTISYIQIQLFSLNSY